MIRLAGRLAPQNLIPDSGGVIRTGDPMQVLERG